MKKELIRKLLDEFDKDREIIVRNLLEVMDEVGLETSNDYEKVTLIIKYVRKGENENEQ